MEELKLSQPAREGRDDAKSSAVAPTTSELQGDHLEQLLTARQEEVALLVADDLTNKQIARRLGISEWTVINHMREVLRKLGCSSRVGVARWIDRNLPR